LKVYVASGGVPRRNTSSDDKLVKGPAQLVLRPVGDPRRELPADHGTDALVQDAAYGTLLKSRRQQLHGRIADVLEEQFPEAPQTQPDLLAQHCAEAGWAEKAAGYWHKAGQRAIARSALAEAIAQLQRGLEVLQGLPEGEARDRRSFNCK
jgi:hypothetical protein